jgi:chromosome partitioning protein
MSRETILRSYIDRVKSDYDYVLIDCTPSLGMLTINALAAADSVIVPVQAHYLPAKGMAQLLQTIARVRRQINPKLALDGVLLTMVDSRTNFARDIAHVLRQEYGDKLRVFQDEIPLSIRAAETSAKGKSIYAHDPNGQVAKAYTAFTKEVQRIGSERRQTRQHQAEHGR